MYFDCKAKPKWSPVLFVDFVANKINWILIFVLIFVMDIPNNIIHILVLFTHKYIIFNLQLKFREISGNEVVSCHIYLLKTIKNKWFLFILRMTVTSSKLRFHVYLFFNKIIAHFGAICSASQFYP